MTEEEIRVAPVLDCGCQLLPVPTDGILPPSLGDYYACSRHSQVYGYDPIHGDALYERDRRVVELRPA